MSDCMAFPETFDEFVESFGFVDSKEYYTNGSELIQVFRVKQWLEHESNRQHNVKLTDEQLNAQEQEANLLNYMKAEAVKEFIKKLEEKKHECGCNYRKKPVYAITEEKICETYKEMVGDAE